ncbi:hypothetical protein, partial [Vibrio cholerae]
VSSSTDGLIAWISSSIIVLHKLRSLKNKMDVGVNQLNIHLDYNPYITHHLPNMPAFLYFLQWVNWNFSEKSRPNDQSDHAGQNRYASFLINRM